MNYKETNSSKCILVIQHFTEIGGSSLASLDVVKALINIGMKVYLLLPGIDSPLANLAKKRGYEVVENCPPVINHTYHSASSGAIRATVKWVKNIKYINQWKEIIDGYKPDFVVLNSGMQSPMIGIVNALHVRCICYVRETLRGSENSIINRWIRKRIGRAWCVAFLTEYDKASWNILHHDHQCILPDVVDSELYSVDSKKKENDIFNVLYLGGLSSEKGAVDLLEAFQCIQDTKLRNKLRLNILGDTCEWLLNMRGMKRWIYRKEIASVKKAYKMIKKINAVSTQIIVEGIQSNVSKWYGTADAVVFPVKKVHQARPVYEAGWYGIPCIVPDYENFRENLIDEYNGIIYKKDEPRELADAIMKLAVNKDLCKMLGDNNRIMAKKKHSEMALQSGLQKIIHVEY